MPDRRRRGSFATFIRRRRHQLKLTQKMVADHVGITPDFVTLIEGGDRRLDFDKIPSLADALQVNRKQLCLQALAERAPQLFCALFSDDAN